MLALAARRCAELGDRPRLRVALTLAHREANALGLPRIVAEVEALTAELSEG